MDTRCPRSAAEIHQQLMGAQQTLPPTWSSAGHGAPPRTLKCTRTLSETAKEPCLLLLLGSCHSHPQHKHQRCKANTCSPSAGWRDRTKPRSQQHPLKFDGIYFSPLSSSQADTILCKPKRTIQNTRNNEPKGCNISEKKNEYQSKTSHPESSGCFALQTARSTSLQHHPSSCSVTQWLRPRVL